MRICRINDCWNPQTEQGEFDFPKGAATVWHLDAIQIPGKANWEESISTLIEVMGSAAEKKNVEYITANNFPPHISNYDYIQEAVVKYHQDIGLGAMDIMIPEFHDENCSNFQGNGGHSRILWKKQQNSS